MAYVTQKRPESGATLEGGRSYVCRFGVLHSLTRVVFGGFCTTYFCNQLVKSVFPLPEPRPLTKSSKSFALSLTLLHT